MAVVFVGLNALGMQNLAALNQLAAASNPSANSSLGLNSGEFREFCLFF